MSLLEFMSRFPDEASCRSHWKKHREKVGIVCKRCGGEKHYWLSNKEQWRCSRCRFQTTLRSGTVMENSKLPFRYWFIAMHLLTATKKGFSTLEIKRQLGHKRYQPIWEMVHKLRSVMGQRDSLYQLESIVEMDEGFFKAQPEEDQQDEDDDLKRGRGSQKQSKVLVMVESEPVDEDKQSKHRPNRKPGHLRMVIIPDLEAGTLDMNAQKCIDPKAEVVTDALPAYCLLSQSFETHTMFNLSKLEANADTLLPWVHISISNAKRWINGNFHHVKQKYLQNYLNEFCFKYNRRYFKERIFDRLLIAAANYHWNPVNSAG